ncbi:MAG: hypothetical protein LBK12_07130 [Odoribacteraceae bacterium]|jgi:hypothetical protein|nr:hypothetical protein [Odoribacteraceae bacterium]
MSTDEIKQLRQASQERIEAIYIDAWEKGVSPRYRDARCKKSNHFISANPDGSEDLVALDMENESFTILQKNITPRGKGYFSYLLNHYEDAPS